MVNISVRKFSQFFLVLYIPCPHQSFSHSPSLPSGVERCFRPQRPTWSSWAQGKCTIWKASLPLMGICTALFCHLHRDSVAIREKWGRKGTRLVMIVPSSGCFFTFVGSHAKREMQSINYLVCLCFFQGTAGPRGSIGPKGDKGERVRNAWCTSPFRAVSMMPDDYRGMLEGLVCQDLMENQALM